MWLMLGLELQVQGDLVSCEKQTTWLPILAEWGVMCYREIKIRQGSKEESSSKSEGSLYKNSYWQVPASTEARTSREMHAVTAGIKSPWESIF